MNNKIIDIEFYIDDEFLWVNICRKKTMWKNYYALTKHRKKLFIKMLGKERFALLFLYKFAE